ncbi:VOC family protein [Rhodococcus rhodnii]|uniref:Dioxygenase n=2 Tax=Rhodococcus rhodnii TaxID=38312 RepID=R7WJ27_9NOCA|nr:VOC family protein [Rhodococcus rhodnii]EOM75272.1 dioxygenase [Rhodococcus rhodnii LMG 5362]TXG92091.1 VOC family protein [Rhodococcus rhodnii]
MAEPESPHPANASFPGRLVGFVASTDLDVSQMFYVETLGLRLVERSDFVLRVDGGGAQLRVTLVQSKADTGYTVLGWIVDDIEAAVAELVERGIEFTRYRGLGQDDRGIWTAPDGGHAAWFRDPHGNVLSLQSR